MSISNRFDEAVRRVLESAPDAEVPDGVVRELLESWESGSFPHGKDLLRTILRDAAVAPGDLLVRGSGLAAILMGVRADQLRRRAWAFVDDEGFADAAATLKRLRIANVELRRRRSGDDEASRLEAALRGVPNEIGLAVFDGSAGAAPVRPLAERIRPGCIVVLAEREGREIKPVAERWARSLQVDTYTISGRKQPFARMIVPAAPKPAATKPPSESFRESTTASPRPDCEIRTHSPSWRLEQRPAEAAVIVPTILRPSLVRAVESVFRQDLPGSIQILIGVDVRSGDPAILDRIREACPANRFVSVVDLGYSTSRRNGGLHPGGCGGALRTILSYAANSRYLAYLDDDNWYREDHLSSLRDAIRGKDWAFSQRWFVDSETSQPICVDRWESVGPGVGAYKTKFGGFVDANCLMIDKEACESVLRWWSIPLPKDRRAMSEDRNVFDRLKEQFSWRATSKPTVHYALSPSDVMHETRLRWIREETQAGAGERKEALAATKRLARA